MTKIITNPHSQMVTRMHSSGMRTARSSSHRGVSTRHPPEADTPPGPGTPPVDRHTSENILPCPKLRLRAVIKCTYLTSMNPELSVSMASKTTSTFCLQDGGKHTF